MKRLSGKTTIASFGFEALVIEVGSFCWTWTTLPLHEHELPEAYDASAAWKFFSTPAPSWGRSGMIASAEPVLLPGICFQVVIGALVPAPKPACA